MAQVTDSTLEKDTGNDCGSCDTFAQGQTGMGHGVTALPHPLENECLDTKTCWVMGKGKDGTRLLLSSSPHARDVTKVRPLTLNFRFAT